MFFRPRQIVETIFVANLCAHVLYYVSVCLHASLASFFSTFSLGKKGVHCYFQSFLFVSGQMATVPVSVAFILVCPKLVLKYFGIFLSFFFHQVTPLVNLEK